MSDCILCGHPQADHHGHGCHGRGSLFSGAPVSFPRRMELAAVA